MSSISLPRIDLDEQDKKNSANEPPTNLCLT